MKIRNWNPDDAICSLDILGVVSNDVPFMATPAQNRFSNRHKEA